MKYKSVTIVFALGLIFLSLFIHNPVFAADENAPAKSQKEVTLPDSCTCKADCPEGYSCWSQLPRGPLAGVPGSADKPGKCYSNEMIKRIY